MPIQYKFFVIPVKTHQEIEADLNRFLRSVRVLSVYREFVGQGENSFWSMAVEYLSEGSEPAKEGRAGKSRIDYKEILSPEAFALFARLRDWRKDLAGKEAVPVYTIFTNDQLAAIAEKKVSTPGDLQKIDGIGEARVSKYGEDIIRIVAGADTKNTPETP